LCLSQIIELLGLAPSTVSKHMAILHQAGLAETRKDGRWIYYRLAGEPHLGRAGASPDGDRDVPW
jgi:ArsR family transcriptional regulator, arsenate/arsenite/antimonite-responsive transcriptional repressor